MIKKTFTKGDKKHLIAMLDNFAYNHYSKGFDYWCETLDSEDKEKILSKARTLNGALTAFINWNWRQGIMYASIQSENCALYEVDKERYDEFQNNAKQSKSGLLKKLQAFINLYL